MNIVAANNKKIKVEKTRSILTSYAGLVAFVNCLRNSRTLTDLREVLPNRKKRKRGYEDVEKLVTLMILMYAGGEHLDDVERLNTDEGLKKMLGIDSIPAPSTLCEYLNGVGREEIEALYEFVTEKIAEYYHRQNVTEVTMDVDSVICENAKASAKWTYKEGVKGYNPMLAVDEERGIVLGGVFRNGNASPQSDILPLVKDIRAALGGGVAITLRMDSAGYQKEIIDYCNDARMGYIVKGDMYNSKRELLKALKDEHWTKCKDREGETTRVKDWIESDGEKTAITMIAKREVREQTDLIEGAYSYHYLVTNITEEEDERLWQLYDKRGNAENVFKGLKGDFWLDDFPCTELEANAMVMQVAMLANNLFQFMKETLLCEEWRRHRLKTIRYKVINLAGYVVKHARWTVLRVNERYCYWQEFLAMAETSQYAPAGW